MVILFGVVASIALPGATIFFVIGPTLALIGVAIRPRSQGWCRGLSWLGAGIQLVILTELIAQIELTLIDGPVAAVAPLVALAALPILAEVGRGQSRRGVGLVALAALGLWIGAMVMSNWPNC